MLFTLLILLILVLLWIFAAKWHKASEEVSFCLLSSFYNFVFFQLSLLNILRYHWVLNSPRIHVNTKRVIFLQMMSALSLLTLLIFLPILFPFLFFAFTASCLFFFCAFFLIAFLFFLLSQIIQRKRHKILLPIVLRSFLAALGFLIVPKW